MLTSLAGFGIGFALLLAPWLLGGGGMGDVKLLGALGAWLGPKLMLIAFGVSILFAALGAVLIVAIVAATEGLMKTQEKHLSCSDESNRRTNNSRSGRRMLPFAVPVALSTWIVLAWIVTQDVLTVAN